MRMKHTAAAVALAFATVGFGTAAVVMAADVNPTASCTAAPAVVDHPDSQEVTVTCSVPKPPPVTATVTVTETVTPTPAPSPTPPPPPPPTTATPTPTPTPPVTTPPTTTGFPDASTTGATSAPTRTLGATTIDTAGAVYDGVKFTGQVRVNANNVTIRNSTIAGGTYGILNYGAGTKVIDVDVVGGDTAGIASYWDSDASTESITVTRADVSGGEDGVRLSEDSVLEDSYVHGLAGGSAGHFDAVTADCCTGWTIRHNTILNQKNQTAAVWIGDSRYCCAEGLLTRNLIGGGGWSMYAGPTTGDGVDVIGNVFTKRFWPKVGYFGLITGFPGGANNTWSGNTYEDGSPANG